MREKPRAKINNWKLTKIFGEWHLTGKITDHPIQARFTDEVQVTSQVLTIDFQNKEAITNNTIYELLEEFNEA